MKKKTKKTKKTKSEEQAIDEVRHNGNTARTPYLPFLMTANEIAMAFDVGFQSVKSWPIVTVGKASKTTMRGRVGTAMYDIRDAIAHRFKTISAKAKPSQKNVDLSNEQTMLMVKRRERLQLHIDEAAGRLAPIAEIESLWSDQLAYFRAALDAMPQRTARQICAAFGITEQMQVEKLLEEAKDEALAKMILYGVEEQSASGS